MITRRGYIVFTALAIALLVAITWIITHVYWNDNGVCLGTFDKCEGQYIQVSHIHTTELF